LPSFSILSKREIQLFKEKTRGHFFSKTKKKLCNCFHCTLGGFIKENDFVSEERALIDVSSTKLQTPLNLISPLHLFFLEKKGLPESCFLFCERRKGNVAGYSTETQTPLNCFLIFRLFIYTFIIKRMSCFEREKLSFFIFS